MRPDRNTGNKLIRKTSSLPILVVTIFTLFSIADRLAGVNRYAELASHFKLQYLVLSCSAGIVFLLKRRTLWLIVSLFYIGVNLTQVVPWYVSQPRAEGAGQHLRLFQSNVQISNQHYSKVLSLVRDVKPDIAIFFEINQPWSRELEALKDILPYSLERQRNVGVRISIYSRLPLENKATQFFGSGLASLLTDINVGGQIVSMIAAHPLTPTTKSGFQQRNAQLEAMGRYVSRLPKPVLVIGDLNITMWSPFYQRFVGTAGLDNARSGFGILPTWPTFFPLLYIPIDHCLISPEIQVLKVRTGPDVGSDHLPLVTDLVIPQNTILNSA